MAQIEAGIGLPRVPNRRAEPFLAETTLETPIRSPV